MLTGAVSGNAATITVTNLNDSGAGSLRQKILDANNGDTIIFQAGLRGPISLNTQLGIDKNITISGPGANVVRISGLDERRVFFIFTAIVTISNLQITNGFSSGAGGGVGVESGGNLTINNCLIDGNVAESAGGVFVDSGAIVTIRNSTISGNVSFVEGGGVSVRGGNLTMTNSTVSGNEAPRGGGVSVENGTATILNSTISGNSTGDSSTSNVGGLRVISLAPQFANVMLKNTIVASNSDSFAPSGVARFDVSGPINSQGTNLIGINDGSVASFPAGNPNANGDFVGTSGMPLNALLSSLANNGGTTQTLALLAGSPAIDAGNNTGAPATDQRGAARPVGAAVDIGAFEAGVPAFSGATSTGSNVNTSLGSVSVTFAGVTQTGTTTQISILPSAAGTLPGGYTFGAGYPAFDISTTANYTAPVVVCIQVPSVSDPMVFAALRIMHYEGGTLVDRTILPPDSPAPDFITRTICSRVNSLSPFVVAENLAPSATTVSVGGRVQTSNGLGIFKARVSITDQNGNTRSALTSAFGYFNFDDVEAGQSYIVSVQSKQHQFQNPTQVIFVGDQISDLIFSALPIGQSASTVNTKEK